MYKVIERTLKDYLVKTRQDAKEGNTDNTALRNTF